jgi:hypothetical protein
MTEEELKSKLADLAERYLTETSRSIFLEYLNGPEPFRFGKFYLSEISLRRTTELQPDDKVVLKKIAHLLGL